MAIEKLLLRPEEAAQLTGVSRAQIYVLMNSGRVLYVTIGQRKRVPVQALREWIASQLADRAAKLG